MEGLRCQFHIHCLNIGSKQRHLTWQSRVLEIQTRPLLFLFVHVLNPYIFTFILTLDHCATSQTASTPVPYPLSMLTSIVFILGPHASGTNSHHQSNHHRLPQISNLIVYPISHQTQRHLFNYSFSLTFRLGYFSLV